MSVPALSKSPFLRRVTDIDRLEMYHKKRYYIINIPISYNCFCDMPISCNRKTVVCLQCLNALKLINYFRSLKLDTSTPYGYKS